MINKMQVEIYLPSKTVIAVDVQPDLKIETLKKQIEGRAEVEADFQDLIFRGSALANARTIKDYPIKAGAKIYLRDSRPEAPSIEPIKFAHSSTPSVNPVSLQVQIAVTTTEKYFLSVKLTDTVASLKEKVAVKIGKPSKTFILSSKDGSINEKLTIEQAGIKGKDTLVVLHLVCLLYTSDAADE
eukprot:TRINITY_DN7852_c0_g2_i7.p1 TRINITY_DN7852_c0_g2~~TRINITY_DN7852_c0_g2_i7.p1  ORF type:complete len:185 (+),score=62.40 TRINITY_DN7852_c0_g2_i7:23-577(+)